MFQELQGDLALWAEDGGGGIFDSERPKGLISPFLGDRHTDFAEIALRETPIKDIELLGLGRKCEGVLEVGNSSCFGHDIFGVLYV